MSQLVRLEGKHSTQNAHCAVVYYYWQISGMPPTFSPPWHLGLPPCTHLLAPVKFTIVLFRQIDDNFWRSLCCSQEICWLAPTTNVQMPHEIFFLKVLIHETRHCWQFVQRQLGWGFKRQPTVWVSAKLLSVVDLTSCQAMFSTTPLPAEVRFSLFSSRLAFATNTLLVMALALATA